MGNYCIEKEYKMMLSKSQFKTLQTKLDYDKVNIQTNHYYSCPNHMGMRIRELDGHYYFTLKHFINNEVREYEWEIEGLSLNDARVQALFKELNINEYKYLGALKTVRYLKYYPKAELCLDENHYLDTIDYELEYELKDANIDDFKQLENILKDLDISFKTNKLTKYKRFLDKLEEIK